MRPALPLRALTVLLLMLSVPCGTAVSAQLPGVTAPAGDTLRAALARGYLRLDRLVSSRTLTDEQRLVLNRAFDRTTLQFFGGQFAAAVTSLDSMARVLGAGPADDPPLPPAGTARQINGQLPSVVRASLLDRLATVDSTGVLQQAHAAATARAALLTDVASTSRSIELFIQPRAHAAAVTREVDALRAGQNPYAGRSGDWWRDVVVGTGRRVPVRLIAPPSAVRPTVRAPLVVALHGAGGDENMFVDAYGAGVLIRLADSLGALVVSPLATGFTASAFDSVVAVVRREYAVDSTRVYVVGHSMGAGVAAMLANTRGAQVAAVAALAGGAPITAADAPPALFMAGGVDPVIPAARVKAAADATRAAGRSVAYREFASEGHTLIVGRVLPEAIGWLFTHRR
jgi:predicted esterase